MKDARYYNEIVDDAQEHLTEAIAKLEKARSFIANSKTTLRLHTSKAEEVINDVKSARANLNNLPGLDIDDEEEI